MAKKPAAQSSLQADDDDDDEGGPGVRKRPAAAPTSTLDTGAVAVVIDSAVPLRPLECPPEQPTAQQAQPRSPIPADSIFG
eukprot:9466968-Pyramimonas_sp.AAC.1